MWTTCSRWVAYSVYVIFIKWWRRRRRLPWPRERAANEGEQQQQQQIDELNEWIEWMTNGTGESAGWKGQLQMSKTWVSLLRPTTMMMMLLLMMIIIMLPPGRPSVVSRNCCCCCYCCAGNLSACLTDKLPLQQQQQQQCTAATCGTLFCSGLNDDVAVAQCSPGQPDLALFALLTRFSFALLLLFLHLLLLLLLLKQLQLCNLLHSQLGSLVSQVRCAWVMFSSVSACKR